MHQVCILLVGRFEILRLVCTPEDPHEHSNVFARAVCFANRVGMVGRNYLLSNCSCMVNNLDIDRRLGVQGRREQGHGRCPLAHHCHTPGPHWYYNIPHREVRQACARPAAWLRCLPAVSWAVPTTVSPAIPAAIPATVPTASSSTRSAALSGSASHSTRGQNVSQMRSCSCSGSPILSILRQPDVEHPWKDGGETLGGANTPFLG